ncbi:MAG: hypothetical protein EP317_02030 [Bacillota bacterium]|nr:MAG: hypothetical protein EP317_02030 [Bacillota bacterium]
MKRIFGILVIALTLVALMGCKDNDSKVEATITDLTNEVKTMSFVMTITDPNNEITGNITVELTAVQTQSVISTRTTNKEALVEGKQTFDYINLTPSTEYRIKITAAVGKKAVTLAVTEFFTKTEDSTITTVEQFLDIVNNRTGNYELANDLDFTGVEFTPMFLQASSGFAGNFNGNGHELSNITFKSIDSYSGIFGNISTGKVSNLVLNNVNIGTEETPLTINKASRIGLLAGYMGSNGSEISNIQVINSNIYVTSSSTISLYVGGLVGESVLGNIQDVTLNQVEVNVTSTSTGTVKVGGVVGFMSDSSSFTRPILKNITSNANVSFMFANTRAIDKSLSHIIGGVVGDNNAQQVNVSVENILNSGNVHVDIDFGDLEVLSDQSYTLNVGGLVGRSYSNIKAGIYAGSININHDAHANDVKVSRTFNVGGLIGTYVISNNQRVTDQLLRLGDNQSLTVTYTGVVNLRISHTIANKDSQSTITVHHFGDLVTLVNTVSTADLDTSIILDTLDAYFTSTWLENVYDDFIAE